MSAIEWGQTKLEPEEPGALFMVPAKPLGTLVRRVSRAPLVKPPLTIPGTPFSLLTRTTKIQQTVAMDCGNRSGKRETYSSTNLRPTEKGLASFDSWPDSVWSIKLINIEVTNRSAQEVYLEKWCCSLGSASCGFQPWGGYGSRF